GCAPAGRGLVAGRACDGADRTARRCRKERGVITRDHAAFLALARGLAQDFGPATARGVFLVAPDGFRLAAESASDNRYMAAAQAFDATAASREHRELQCALATVLPAVCFPGDPDAPDGLFPNNVFATVPG